MSSLLQRAFEDTAIKRAVIGQPKAMTNEQLTRRLHHLEHRQMLLQRRLDALTANDPDIVAIQEQVARAYNLTRKDLLGPSRTVRIAWPRIIAIHLCRHRLKRTQTQIGHAFSRAASDICHSLKAAQNRLDTDAKARAEITRLESELTAKYPSHESYPSLTTDH